MPVLAGVAAGVLLSLAAGRLIAGFLFEIEPHDPLTLLGTAAATALVGLAAMWLPALRATKLDPLKALRAP